MHRLLYILGGILLWIAPMSAQRAGISGRIIEKTTGEPIEQATVRLLNPQDSTFLRGTASNKDGDFTFTRIRPGEYLLNVTFVGFNSLYKAIQVTGEEPTLSVGNLAMSDANILLDEATVIGQAPEMTIRNDTIEYNAESFKVAEGSALEDLLKKMPGVEVDTEGNITVNGEQITKIMVDGKEFFSDDPKVASKNLPADMIDKVQVHDRKSDMARMTGFDDGEEERVINLTIKPGMKHGWFGNAYAGYGTDDRYEGNIMANRFVESDQFTLLGSINNTNNMGFTDMATSMFSGMRGGRRGNAGNGITTSGNIGTNFSKEFSAGATLGGNVQYSHSDNDARSTSSTQTFLTGDSISYSDNRVTNNSISNNVGIDLRFEWKPDTLTTILFTPNFGYSSSNTSNIQETNTRINEDTLNISNSEVFSDGAGYDVGATLNYSRKLNSRGRTFSFSLSGGVSDSYNNESNYSVTDYLKEGNTETIDQRIRYDNTGFNYRAFLSWVEPLGKGLFLQATYSISQRKQESLKNAYVQGDDGSGLYNVLDTASSQNYRNNFITQRASLSLKLEREKYLVLLGLNVDPSYSRSENFIGDTTLSDISRSVVNFSPTFRLNYRFDQRTNLRIDYNGRTSQPSMTQLQPVTDNSDPLNIVSGNPELKPQYTNNLFATFNKFTPERQRAMMFSLQGTYTLNAIVSKTTYNSETGGKYTTYENVDGNYSLNARGMVNTPLRNRKFSINSNTNISLSGNNSFVNGEKNRATTLSANERIGANYRSDLFDLGLNTNFRFTSNTNSLQSQTNLLTYNYGVGGNASIYFPWDIRLETDINWNSNSGYADGYDQNEVIWNAALSKSFLKGNQATIRLKMYDILQMQSNISRTITASMISDSQYNTIGSYFMVHFIYRFSAFGGNGRREGPPGDGPGGRGGMPPGPPGM